MNIDLPSYGIAVVSVLYKLMKCIGSPWYINVNFLPKPLFRLREKTREKNNEPEPDTAPKLYIIIGVGVVAILLAIYIIVYEIFKRRRKKAQSQQNNNSETLLTKVPWDYHPENGSRKQNTIPADT